MMTESSISISCRRYRFGLSSRNSNFLADNSVAIFAALSLLSENTNTVSTLTKTPDSIEKTAKNNFSKLISVVKFKCDISNKCGDNDTTS